MAFLSYFRKLALNFDSLSNCNNYGLSMPMQLLHDAKFQTLHVSLNWILQVKFKFQDQVLCMIMLDV